MEAAKSLPPTKSLPQTFDKLIEELPGLIKTDQELPVAKQSNATEPGDDIVAFGDDLYRGDREANGGVAHRARLPAV